MSNSFVGYQCWEPERIGIVINKEALAMDRATFLATHVPMRRIAYERSPQQIKEASERTLLAELNNQATTDQHVFAVIKGIPGTGKSHLIRWLKEQYALAHPNDAVLLIARANTSLRSTIQQIIDSQLFRSDALPEALKSLQGAIDILNQETLAERLLNGLQEITHTSWEEMRSRLERAGNALHRRLSAEKVDRFLLDHQVRSVLRQTEGPIERITDFLTVGRGNTADQERLLGFEADDFDFDVDTLRRLRSGGAYRDVLGFCEDLHEKEEIRQSLARYLNFALHNYAIGNATQLATGDLRTIFNELRRHLRVQGKNLALFIEDITAFTGIDEGLIEVLVTQHRGEANTDFCRLLSVSGITDSYFTDRFPDNIKERVTHQLTLNAQSGRNESDLLKDQSTLTEFAARYLNAMRVKQDELSTWAEHGASADALPNPCTHCQFQPTCHAAFGTVKLSGDHTNGELPQVIGLYPFNHKAVSTLYQFLKDGVSKTPRTFLNSLLAYILQSHGSKIADGEFPPPATDLANDVNLPMLNPANHRRLIQEQSSDHAKRIESLLLFWGNGNAFRQKDDAQERIGGVPLDIFRAFKLKVISGAQQEQATVQPQVIETKQPIAPQRVAPANNSEKTPVAPVVSQYTERISTWANGGKLYEYNQLATWLKPLVSSFIDWQAYGISSKQVEHYITANRLVIEDQSGAVTKGHSHLFQRSDDLHFVLQALADLNDSNVMLEPAQLSEHFVTLSTWLRSQEADIVAFVREPTLQSTTSGQLVHILLQNCILLACLSGDINSGVADNPTALYEQVLATCIRSTEDGWRTKMEQMGKTFPVEWTSLMRKTDVSGAAHICRTELLQLLNRSQGKDIRYLDAAIALETINSFNETHWSLSAITESLRKSIQERSNDQTWKSALQVYGSLDEGFTRAIHASYNQLADHHREIVQYLSEDTSTGVFEAVQSLLSELKQQKHYPPTLDSLFEHYGNSPLSLSRKLDKLLEESGALLAKQELHNQAAIISQHYERWSNDLNTFLEWFKLLAKTINKQKQELSEEGKRLRSQSNADEKYEDTLQKFDEIIESLAPYLIKEAIR